MRVIAQNGKLDFPYGQIVITYEGNRVTCNPISNMSGRYYLLGEYSTDEKAKKAMEMLRIEYENTCYCNDGFDSAAQLQRSYLFMRNVVFQFPQDSEVEV